MSGASGVDSVAGIIGSVTGVVVSGGTETAGSVAGLDDPAGVGASVTDSVTGSGFPDDIFDAAVSLSDDD